MTEAIWEAMKDEVGSITDEPDFVWDEDLMHDLVGSDLAAPIAKLLHVRNQLLRCTGDVAKELLVGDAIGAINHLEMALYARHEQL